MNKKLKRKQALIMAEPYRTPFNSKVAKVSGDVIEDSVGEIKYATSFDGATKIVDANKNLLSLPNIEETTIDGITYNVKDGVITFSGTLTRTSGLNLWIPLNNSIQKNKTYYKKLFYSDTQLNEGNLWLCKELDNYNDRFQMYYGTIDTTYDITYLMIYIETNKTYINETYRPMLVLGTTAPTEFEPNFKNLLEFDDQDLEVGGVKINIKNGIFTLNGTANGTHQILYMQLDTNPVGIYSWNNFGSGKTLFIIGYIGVYSDNESQTFDFGKDNIHGFSWQIKDGEVYDNYVIKPMLVKSSIIPTQFIPFANPYFVSLGQKGSVQYNGLEPREIDLKGNVISKINNQASDKLSNYALTKNIKVVDLGSLTWEATDKTVNNKYRMSSQSLKSEIVYSSSSSSVGNIISTTYNSLSTNDTYLEKKGISLETDGTIKIYDPEYNTSDKLEAFKKAIRGTLLMYQVKNPTTINTTSFKTFKEDTNATISDNNFTSSPNAITETFKPTRSYDFKVNGFSNVVKSSNLFFLPNIASTTKGGMTFSASNQKMNLSGTNTYQYIPFYSINMTSKLVVGKTYVLQCSNHSIDLMLQANIKKSDGTYVYYTSYDNSRFTWTSDYTEILVIAQNSSAVGTAVNLSNITFGLYETDNVSIPYEPYFDPYIESFADKKNLLGFDDVEETTTTGGVTYSIKNGVFTLNGTSSKSHNIFINFKKPINSGIYSFNAFTTTGSRADIYLNAPLVPLANLAASPTKSNISLTSATQLSVYFPKDEKYDNRTFKPMLVEGNKIPTTFLPYQDKYSAFLNVKGKNLLEFEPYYSFTKEVLIKQPLRKFDYLTYDGVYRQTNEIVLDGTNNIYVEESSGVIQVLNIPNVDSLNTDWVINYASQLMVTTSDLPLVQSYLIQVEKQKGIGTNNGRIFIKLDDSADNSLNNWTVEKVNNYFKQNPITITYKTVDQTFEATSLTRLLFKNGYNKITAFDSINNNAIVEYLEYYKSKGD